MTTAKPIDSEPSPMKVERGLRAYVSQVATQLGTGPGSQWSELAESASAYIALDDRIPGLPGRDLALIWDDVRGWAVAAESSSAEDLEILASYDGDLLPDPRLVAQFARRVLAGHPGRQSPPAATREPRHAALAPRLAAYG